MALGLSSVVAASDNTTYSGTTPAILTNIAVSPVNPSVVSGQTEQFTAQGLDQDGNVMTEVAFIWDVVSSQNETGTIDSSTGVFTAGTTSGTLKDAIEAKSDNVTGTTSVNIAETASDNTTEVASDNTTETASDNTTEVASDNTTEITSDNTTETTSFIVRLVAGLARLHSNK